MSEILGLVLEMKSHVLQLQWSLARNKNHPGAASKVGLGACGRIIHDGFVPYETPHHTTEHYHNNLGDDIASLVYPPVELGEGPRVPGLGGRDTVRTYPRYLGT